MKPFSSWGILCFVVGVCACTPAISPAAAPTLTYLFPAGTQRGKTVEVTAGGAFERWPVQAWIDRKGVEIKPAAEKGLLTVTVAADAAPGTYWLRLFDDEGATALRPFLVGMLPEVLEQEPNDDFKKPQVLASTSVTVNGRLAKSGDVDCFALKLNKGQTLVASMEAHQTLGSPMDAILQILSSDGFVLAQNNDFHGLDPQIVFPVPSDATYIVRTFAFPAAPDSGIGFAGGETYIYRLTLTTDGFADHAFPLAVARSAPAPVEIKGWNIPETARKLTLPVDEPSSLFPPFFVPYPSPFGVVRVRREPHPVIVQNKLNDRQHPQSITPPVTISGCLEKAGDVHAYRFEAKKGQKVNFQAEAQVISFPLNPVLRLTDSAGKSIAKAEGATVGRDPELSFDVSLDGAYQIELQDLHGEGGPRFIYCLRAVFPEPDFELTVTADRFLLTPGKDLEIPVTVERRHGFAQEIDLVVEGLPKGAMAAPVLAAPGAKTGTVRVSAGAATGSGSIRILGKARDKMPLTRAARSPLAGLTASTPDFWLTIPKAEVKR
jgi:hypothetical protein